MLRILLISLLFSSCYVHAKCLELKHLPQDKFYVQADECVIFTGHDTSKINLAIAGKFTLRADASLHFKQAKILLSKKGQFINHGNLRLEQSSLALYQDSVFKNSLGQFNLIDNAALYSFDQALVHNGGVFLIKDSKLELESKTMIVNSGTIEGDKAIFNYQQGGLKNEGRVKLFNSSLTLVKGELNNLKELNIKNNSLVMIADEAKLNNIKALNIEQQLDLRGSLFNKGVINIHKGARLNLQQQAYLQNEHMIMLEGQLQVYDKARLYSEALLQVKKEAQLSLRDQALFVNDGTLRLQGRLEGRDKIINNKILYEDRQHQQ